MVSEIYLDVETQRLSSEVPGGWNNIRAFGLSVAVTWDDRAGFREWHESDASRLIEELAAFDRLVTFNGVRFDLEVLAAYGNVQVLRGKTLDILKDLERRLGFRTKLQDLARATLGKGKTGSGLDAVAWWRSGDPVLQRRVVEYCRMDVELLRDIVAHGRRDGFVKVPSSGKDRTVYVAWEA
jgi:DEAD/DEAH box helicase domain-containing protein